MEPPQEMKVFLNELGAFLSSVREADVSELEWEKGAYGFKATFGDAHGKKREEVSANGRNESVRDLYRVVSPVVGTFHFQEKDVAVGRTVKPKEPLGCVKAVNVEHWVEAHRPGALLEIHVNEGQPVEFGQLLFTIEGPRVS